MHASVQCAPLRHMILPGLSCQSIVHLIWSLVFQPLMWPPGIIKSKVVLKSDPGFRDALVILQVHVFIFYRPPKAFHKDVVQSPTPAIHAEADVFPEHSVDKLPRGELHALIGIEDPGPPMMFDSVFEGFQAKARF